MINPVNKLTVISEISSVLSDLSDSAADYLKDKFSLTLDNSDYLYIGFYKPFGTVFAELSVGNTVTTDKLLIEYFDGTNWVDGTVSDETNGLSRSGFLSWNKEDMEETIIDSNSKYYVRLSLPTVSTAIEFCGINCLFSDDCSLQEEYYEIVDDCLFAGGFKSHITAHVSARNHIMQMLRNDGYVKYSDKCVKENITYFDLLDKFEVRQAAIFLALSKIFFRMADDQESVYWAKYKEYQEKFEAAFNVAKLSVDTNNNGLADNNESVATKKNISWSR